MTFINDLLLMEYFCLDLLNLELNLLLNLLLIL